MRRYLRQVYLNSRPWSRWVRPREDHCGAFPVPLASGHRGQADLQEEKPRIWSRTQPFMDRVTVPRESLAMRETHKLKKTLSASLDTAFVKPSPCPSVSSFLQPGNKPVVFISYSKSAVTDARLMHFRAESDFQSQAYRTLARAAQRCCPCRCSLLKAVCSDPHSKPGYTHSRKYSAGRDDQCGACQNS